MDCDGCGVPMDGETYQIHECPAYKDSEHRNPLTHKMAGAVWKKPGGGFVPVEINARGNVIIPGEKDLDLGATVLTGNIIEELDKGIDMTEKSPKYNPGTSSSGYGVKAKIKGNKGKIGVALLIFALLVWFANS